MTSDKTECCPRFDPAPWEEKERVWKDKPFIRDDVTQLFHIPLNMGTVVKRMWKRIQDADARPKDSDFIMLAYDPSPWKSELYMTVTKEVPGARNVKISGTFITKVYDGPFNAVPKWIRDMDAYLAAGGKKALKYYFYYTTCPKCAKKYGHNYCVAFAQVG
ncbi:MAG: hypothetical protein JW724_07435 [Candidatus Altiarchaeota archaeon]|nr:hypothetical protein [Candidatus Altiarchaeota archaeon]